MVTRSLCSFPIIFFFSVMGLYVSVILVVARAMRVGVMGQHSTIMYRHLPFVDLILVILLDIYMVRESGEYRLEEELFAKMLFLYRSPETMVKVTKRPVNLEEQLAIEKEAKKERKRQKRLRRKR